MIDWDKPYGKICGIPHIKGARYEQKNQYYDVHGNEVPAAVDTIYQSMHWKALKKMVEDVGGEWTNKAEAVKFLESRNG